MDQEKAKRFPVTVSVSCFADENAAKNPVCSSLMTCTNDSLVPSLDLFTIMKSLANLSPNLDTGSKWPRDTKGSWRSFVVLNLCILVLRQTSQWILWHVAHSVTKAYGLSHQNFTPLTFINEPVTIIFLCLFSWWRGHWRFGFTCECFWYNCSEGFL